MGKDASKTAESHRSRQETHVENILRTKYLLIYKINPIKNKAMNISTVNIK